MLIGIENRKENKEELYLPELVFCLLIFSVHKEENLLCRELSISMYSTD